LGGRFGAFMGFALREFDSGVVEGEDEWCGDDSMGAWLFEVG
jgi:hypothetical protein